MTDAIVLPPADYSPGNYPDAGSPGLIQEYLWNETSVRKAIAVQAAKQVPEGWIVVKQHAWDQGDGERPTLAYLWPAEFNREIFTSFEAASQFIYEPPSLPLGWVALKIAAAPSAPSRVEAAEAGQVEALLHLWGAFRTTEVHGDPVASKQRFRMIFTFPTLEALHAADDKWMHLTGSDSQRCTSLNAGLSTVAGEAIATTPMAAEANEPDWRHPKLQAMLSQEARKHIEARLICEVLDASTVEELEDVYSNDYETELFSRVKELKHSALAATPTSPQAPAPQAVVGEASGVAVRSRALADEVLLALESYSDGGTDKEQLAEDWSSGLLPKVYDTLNLFAALTPSPAPNAATQETTNQPTWFEVETPGAEFDVSFVQTMEEALQLNEGDPDAASYITPLYEIAPSAAPHQGADALWEALVAARTHIDFMRGLEKSVRAIELQSEAIATIDAALAQHQAPQQGEQQ